MNEILVVQAMYVSLFVWGFREKESGRVGCTYLRLLLSGGKVSGAEGIYYELLKQKKVRFFVRS